MADERVKKLAKVIVDYSVAVKKGENVIISSSVLAEPLVREVYKLVLKKRAYPLMNIGLDDLSYYYYKNASKEQLKKFPKIFEYQVKNSQVYIGIGAPANTRSMANIDGKKMAVRSKVTQPISDYIVNAKKKIRRVSMDYPTNALAQDANMSLSEYEDFLFGACLQDWKKLRKRMHKIKKVLDKGKVFHIVSKDTDIKLGIKDRPFIVDAGEENMPGGEIFNAPLEKQTEGHIRFTYPSIKSGKEVTNIYLEFKKGKIVKATSDKNQDFLRKMLKTDKGSEYVGEIGIGFNPKITKFTNNLLFDEKISKTIHLALGMAYTECKGTNKSALHWDIVKDLSKDGKIYLDGKLINNKGKWLI